MRLLRNVDFIANLTGAAPPVPAGVPPAIPQVLGVRPYLADLPLPAADAERYTKDSSVQPSSVDLHIGAIYLPGTKEDPGDAARTKTDHVLKTGETAVVTTKETLRLPDNIAAFGFPPSSVSFKGLLMTNPGHVDPGYVGVLRFTVINMGKNPYPLNQGDSIVTMLFFVLDDRVHTGYADRNPGAHNVRQSDVDRLSKDFVDVERRAKAIAKSQGVQWSIYITGGVALIVAILQAFSSGHLFYRQDIEDLKTKQQMVEYDVLHGVTVQQKLQDFDKRLTDIEIQLKQSRPVTK